MEKNSLLKNNIFTVWLLWHFWQAPKFLFEVYKNYLWFCFHYFSVLSLLNTLFSPWRKYKWRYPKWFQIGEFVYVFLSNVFSRFLGFSIRLLLIFLGLVAQIIVFSLGILFILCWFVMPAFLVFLLILLFL